MPQFWSTFLANHEIPRKMNSRDYPGGKAVAQHAHCVLLNNRIVVQTLCLDQMHRSAYAESYFTIAHSPFLIRPHTGNVWAARLKIQLVEQFLICLLANCGSFAEFKMNTSKAGKQVHYNGSGWQCQSTQCYTWRLHWRAIQRKSILHRHTVY